MARTRETNWESGRLLTLVDGIFAIAMTIMVLDLNIPEGLTNTELDKTLWHYLPRLAIYLLSFFILGRMWLVHHGRFQHIVRIDPVYASLSLGSLAFVALVPAGTALVSDYSADSHAVMVYTGILAVSTLFEYLAWKYATSAKHLVSDELSARAQKQGEIRNLAFLAMCLGVIAVAFARPGFALYFLVGLLLFASPMLHWLSRER